MYILLTLWLIVMCLSCGIIYIVRNNMDYISVSVVQNLQYIPEYKDLFVNEYMNYYSINKWTIFSENDPSLDYDKLKSYSTPSLTNYLFRNNTIIGVGKPSIEIMWLKMNGISIEENIVYAAQTNKYINTVRGIVNCGILVVEPGYEGNILHKNYKNTARYYMPLFIPIGDSGININRTKNILLDDADVENIDVFFDINDPHRLWNYTNTNLALLFIDIKIN